MSSVSKHEKIPSKELRCFLLTVEETLTSAPRISLFLRSNLKHFLEASWKTCFANLYSRSLVVACNLCAWQVQFSVLFFFMFICNMQGRLNKWKKDKRGRCGSRAPGVERGRFICGFRASKGPFVNTGIGTLASALELAWELVSILLMCEKTGKTDQGVVLCSQLTFFWVDCQAESPEIFLTNIFYSSIKNNSCNQNYKVQ